MGKNKENIPGFPRRDSYEMSTTVRIDKITQRRLGYLKDRCGLSKAKIVNGLVFAAYVAEVESEDEENERENAGDSDV